MVRPDAALGRAVPKSPCLAFSVDLQVVQLTWPTAMLVPHLHPCTSTAVRHVSGEGLASSSYFYFFFSLFVCKPTTRKQSCLLVCFQMFDTSFTFPSPVLSPMVPPCPGASGHPTGIKYRGGTRSTPRTAMVIHC